MKEGEEKSEIVGKKNKKNIAPAFSSFHQKTKKRVSTRGWGNTR